MAARKRNRHEPSEEAEVNMTPMIDVVFLLIIFFLCIDFRILEAKLPAHLPKDVGSSQEPVEPQEKLRIKIVCTNWGTPQDRPFQPEGRQKKAFFLNDHRVHYTIGPRRVATLEDLHRELSRLRPGKTILDTKTGERRPIGVVIEPGTKVVYGDVAPCVDTVLAADFPEITFGGGLGSRGTGAYSQQRRPR